MPISRSVESRHLEALRLLYLADADVVTQIGDSTNCRVGPFVPDQNAEGEFIIRPRQLNLLLAPDIGISVDVGGTAEQFVPLATVYYDHPNTEPYTVGSPNTNPYDFLVHLQKLQMKGSGEGDPITYNNMGKLINPDDPSNPDPVQRYLNILPPEFRTVAMGAPTKGNTARIFAFYSIYVTEVDNITRVRV